MNKSTVAVLFTKPETILEDYDKILRLANIKNYISENNDIFLKINISWHYFYPACSTTPWQIEGTILSLLNQGYNKDRIYAIHNRTVVVSAKKGEINNKQKPVIDKYGIKNIHLYEKGEKWIYYKPKSKIRVLNEIYPDGIRIPERFIGANIIHLPTVKTHVFTTTTGAMKNAFGGLLHNKRHWTHSVIHETLVDLLHIQKEIHTGIFAVMDGTWAGEGPGPRCMIIHEKNIILASQDQVAIDAVSAKLMGLNPLNLKYIRLAHNDGLGVGDIRDIKIVGDDISNVNWKFKFGQTLASKGQHLIYWGGLHFLEKALLRTFISPWSYLASYIYHDCLWYPLVGLRRINKALSGNWGKLFKSYPYFYKKTS